MAETIVTDLARKFAVDVAPGNEADPAWVRLRGRTSLQSSVTATMQDDTDDESDGWASSVKTLLAWGLNMTIKRGKGVTSGDYDPGQEILRAAHDKFGIAGVVQVRWYDREGGPDAYRGFAEVGWEPQGGNPTALDFVNVTLTGKGKREAIANPVVTGEEVPTIASVVPVTGPATGGTLVVVTGDHFTGTTGVSFAGTAATEFEVLNDGQLVAVTPAHAAGAGDVVVTNAEGPSTDGPDFTFTA